jgi:hypothetical protein
VPFNSLVVQLEVNSLRHSLEIVVVQLDGVVPQTLELPQLFSARHTTQLSQTLSAHKPSELLSLTLLQFALLLLVPTKEHATVIQVVFSQFNAVLDNGSKLVSLHSLPQLDVSLDCHQASSVPQATTHGSTTT